MLRNALYACCFVLGFVGVAAGSDLEVVVEKHQAISVGDDSRKVGGWLLIPADSAIEQSELAIFKIATPAKFVFIDAEGSDEEFVDVVSLGGGEYLLAGQGRYKVTVNVFDEANGFARKRLRVELGKVTPPAPPTPPEPPPSPVPADMFDNLGQRVAGWAAGLPKRREVAAIYRESAVALVSDPLSTIDTTSGKLVAKRSTVLGADLPKYQSLHDNLQVELKQRWPMSRGTYADWLNAIAAGLDGAK